MSVNTMHFHSWFSQSELDLHFGNHIKVPVRGKLGFLFCLKILEHRKSTLFFKYTFLKNAFKIIIIFKIFIDQKQNNIFK